MPPWCPFRLEPRLFIILSCSDVKAISSFVFNLAGLVCFGFHWLNSAICWDPYYSVVAPVLWKKTSPLQIQMTPTLQIFWGALKTLCFIWRGWLTPLSSFLLPSGFASFAIIVLLLVLFLCFLHCFFVFKYFNNCKPPRAIGSWMKQFDFDTLSPGEKSTDLKWKP